MSGKPDIVIIGSGMGGGTVAAALAPSGCAIMILERGDHIRECPQCTDAKAVFGTGYFRPDEQWLDARGTRFNPGNYYYVGGNSKFYGGVMLRLRAEDFGTINHLGGTSPAWPISYEEFEPWYQAAEQMYKVCGSIADDPTEPLHSGTYLHDPIADEPDIGAMRTKLSRAGVTPAPLPLAVDIKGWLRHAQIPWDAFPDTSGSKHDAESIGVARALEHDNVALVTGAKVMRLQTDDNDRISEIEYVKDGQVHSIKAHIVVLAAGAVNSAVILLSSANEAHPRGLANRSDQVGRNFMNHNTSALLALHPLRRNRAVYQKTLQFNDFYLRGGTDDKPLGNVQLLGKISGTILASQTNLPSALANWLAARSVDWYTVSEDLPNANSRVSVRDNRVVLNWQRTNWQAQKELVDKTKKVLRKAGFPVVLAKEFDRRTPSHQCGTMRFGNDPDTSVLDIYCRSHDHANLFVIDACFMPSSAAVNPALTIAAQALRSADHILRSELS